MTAASLATGENKMMTLYYNCTILTVDKDMPKAEAVLAEERKSLVIGTLVEVQNFRVF